MANPIKTLPSQWQVNKLLPRPVDYEYFKDWQRFKFEPDKKDHSAINAWWLADCSLFAYEDKTKVESTLLSVSEFEKEGKLKWQWLNEGSSQGFMVEADDFFIVSLRGTEFYPIEKILRYPWLVLSVLRDFRADVRLTLKTHNTDPVMRYKVADGFYHEFQNTWKQVEKFIGTSSDKPIWLTGHSLGAAINTLVAFQLDEPHRTKLYTYGSPCVGGDDFATEFKRRKLDTNTYRYVHGNDIVVKALPYSRKIFGSPRFQHVGKLRTRARNPFSFSLWINLNIFDHSPIYYTLQTWNMIPDE